MRIEENNYKLPIKLNCLVLCTTEKEDKTRAASLKTALSDEIDDPTVEDLEPGYLLYLKNKVLYKTFSTRQPFLWQREVIEWIKNFLPVNKIAKIKIMTEDLSAIKLFYKGILDLKSVKKPNLILSEKSQLTLSKTDPIFFEKIRQNIISEKEDFFKKLKLEQSNKTIAQRIIGVSQNTTLTALERKLYLFFLGKNLKGINDKDIKYLIFDKDKIANELTESLKFSKEDIFKAIDRLIKKALISIIKEYSTPFFMISDNGPVDLL